MLNFRQELDKLLAEEETPLPQFELAELLTSGQNILSSLNKKQTDISMQVEEIYDIISESGEGPLLEALSSEKRHTAQLVKAVINLCDIIEDFKVFAHQSGDGALLSQALMMWKNIGTLLEECAITRLGEKSQRLDPEIHTVHAVMPSSVPREHIVQILRSGYRHMGTVARKAIVIVSEGKEIN